MTPAVVVTNVGKAFRLYHPHRPATIQEAVAKGLRGIRPVEKFWGLRDVSFTVDAGRAVGIIGANGSGKSTLLRLIGGVGRPDTGQIVVNGRLGALLDLGAGFHPDLTGRENAILASVLSGLTRQQALQRLESIVAFAEVEKALDHPIRTFSSGMLMRLAFSVAVHADPEVLLIDEVLSVGDVGFQRKCMDRIAQFKSAGCAILVVSHEGSLVEGFCDDAIWLSGGQLMLQGRADEVVRQYASYMGGTDTDTVTPAMTVVESSRQRFGSMELEIRTVRILDRHRRPIDELASGQPVRLELGYAAKRSLVGPIFCSRILRDDGVVCYDLYSEFSSETVIEGSGQVALSIDRLDLNTGRYIIEVGCYSKDWGYAYDYQYAVASLEVRGAGGKDAVMNAPYRWEFMPTRPHREQPGDDVG